jgi:hypothetical protein
MFVSKAGASSSKQFSGALTYGSLLALPTNIWLGWKGLPRTNTLAFYKIIKLEQQKVLKDWPGSVKSHPNIIPGWEWLVVTNALAYYVKNQLWLYKAS